MGTPLQKEMILREGRFRPVSYSHPARRDEGITRAALKGPTFRCAVATPLFIIPRRLVTTILVVGVDSHIKRLVVHFSPGAPAMATTQVSLEEYLRTDYEPDCDYVDGELEERNVGEKEHSAVQAFFIKWLADTRGAMEIGSVPGDQNARVADADARCRYRHPSAQCSV